MLNQIIYLRRDTLIGTAWLTADDMVDVGDPSRAKVLDEQGVGLLVSEAPRYLALLNDIRSKGDECPELVQFLNRVKSFPLNWQTPEWEALVASLGPAPITFSVNVNVNDKPKRKKKVEE